MRITPTSISYFLTEYSVVLGFSDTIGAVGSCLQAFAIENGDDASVLAGLNGFRTLAERYLQVSRTREPAFARKVATSSSTWERAASDERPVWTHPGTAYSLIRPGGFWTLL